MANPNDPFGTPPPAVTQAEVKQGKRDQENAILKAATIGAGFVAINSAANAAGGKVVQRGISTLFTGPIHMKPGPHGVPSWKVTPTSVVIAFAPLPVGFVPPEAYGLSPDFYSRNFGVPRSTTFGTQPTDTRLKVHEARAYAGLLNDNFRRLLGDRSANLNTQFNKHYPPQAPTREQIDFLRALPPGFSDAQKLLPALEQRYPDLFAVAPVTQTPIPQGPLDTAPNTSTSSQTGEADYGGDVLPGSTQPQNFHPTNRKGIENEAAAEGIRRDLVTERFDP